MRFGDQEARLHRTQHQRDAHLAHDEAGGISFYCRAGHVACPACSHLGHPKLSMHYYHAGHIDAARFWELHGAQICLPTNGLLSHTF